MTGLLSEVRHLKQPEVMQLVPEQQNQKLVLSIFIQFPEWDLSAASDVPCLLFSLFSFLPSQLSFLLSTAAAFTPNFVNKSIILKVYSQQDPHNLPFLGIVLLMTGH